MQHDTDVDAPKILVVGTGELGLSVIRALAARSRHAGARITALLRPEAASPPPPPRRTLLEELETLDVAIVYADIGATDAAGLAETFRPFRTVVNCTGFVAGPGTQLKLAAAVLAAGVERYVPWQFGVDYDTIETGSGGGIFDEQIAVRALLRAQQATCWTIVSTGMFTSFLFEPAFDVANLQELTVNALGSWDTRVTVTTPEDIGKLTGGHSFHAAGRYEPDLLHCRRDDHLWAPGRPRRGTVQVDGEADGVDRRDAQAGPGTRARRRDAQVSAGVRGRTGCRLGLGNHLQRQERHPDG
jgi:hypothetical protein